MTDFTGNGTPDPGLAGNADPSMPSGDNLAGFMNDPGVRRGARVAGRFAVGYLIVFALFSVVVLGFIVFVAAKVF